MFPGGAGRDLTIAMLAIDSGYNTQQVYNWARRYPMSRVIACKGTSSARTLVGSPSPVDVTARGKRLQRGYKVWAVGVSIAKAELYGWLRLARPTGDELAPPGYCHFPEHGEDYFKQLTAEHLVTVAKRNGFTSMEWQVLPNRENHGLDCRVYARAAASVLGIDRLVAPAQRPRAPAAPPRQAETRSPAPPLERSRQEKEAAPASVRPGPWLKGGKGRGGKGGWLRGRRR